MNDEKGERERKGRCKKVKKVETKGEREGDREQTPLAEEK